MILYPPGVSKASSRTTMGTEDLVNYADSHLHHPNRSEEPNVLSPTADSETHASESVGSILPKSRFSRFTKFEPHPEEGSQHSDSDSNSDEEDEDVESVASSGSGSVYDESTRYDESTMFTERLTLKKMKGWNKENKVNEGVGKHRVTSPNKQETLAAQSKAYEKLLRYAYTALSVPPPTEIIEKGEEGPDNDTVLYPAVLSPQDAVQRRESMDKLLAKLSSEGMEVLKLNRENKWQQRFLTITREVMQFKKSDDIRFSGINTCPKGLLWVKKFDSKNHTVASIGKDGKGGMLFNAIQHVSVTKDNHPLSRKQKKGKFKDSITFSLHSNTNGMKRKVLFRCMTKEDVFALSAGFQAIIDRIDNDASTSKGKGKQNKLSIETKDLISPPPRTPLASTKPFSPKAVATPIFKLPEDRWEV